MSTASGLVFTGDNDGYFYAFDAASGKELWRFPTGAPVWGSAPVSYMRRSSVGAHGVGSDVHGLCAAGIISDRVVPEAVCTVLAAARFL